MLSSPIINGQMFDHYLIVELIMQSLDALSNCLTRMALVLEQYQARCQGIGIDVNLPDQDKESYPTLTFSATFLKDQQLQLKANGGYIPHQHLVTSSELQQHLENVDRILIENSKNSKKPLGDCNLRKMRKLLPDIQKKQIAERIKVLILQGKIIDQSNE